MLSLFFWKLGVLGSAQMTEICDRTRGASGRVFSVLSSALQATSNRPIV